MASFPSVVFFEARFPLCVCMYVSEQTWQRREQAAWRSALPATRGSPPGRGPSHPAGPQLSVGWGILAFPSAQKAGKGYSGSHQLTFALPHRREDGLVIARPSHPLFLWDVTQFAPSVWGHSLQMFLDRGREGTCSSLSAGGWEPGSILCMATCPATDQSFWF